MRISTTRFKYYQVIRSNTMETVSLKMGPALLREIDNSIKNNRYSTRTEFIRDAIRRMLSDFEKEEAIMRLSKMKGSLKGKAKYNDEELVGEIAVRNLARKMGVKLD